MSRLVSAVRICAIELLAALRDRQTLMYTVVLPLVLYPALFWVMLQGFTLIKGRDEITAVELGVVGALETVSEERLFEALAEAPETDRDGGELGTIHCRALAPMSGAEAAEALTAEDSELDAILLLGETPASLLFEGTRGRSRLARDRAAERLAALAQRIREEELEETGHDPTRLTAFTVGQHDLASERDLAAYVFSHILPMTFVIMAVMGAFYPAVDVTAGEKERGTAETTLLLPVGRTELHVGKILSVCAAATIATVLNLLGLVVAAEPLLAGMGAGVSIEVPWSSLLLAFPLCAAFLLTTSAILVAMATLTDTFKQGQALLGGVQLAFILPAMFGILPGIELSPGLALVPVVQTVLAFKTVLQGTAGHGVELLLVFVSQLAYAWLALKLSMRLSSREALLVSGASIRRLFSLWRTEGAPR